MRKILVFAVAVALGIFILDGLATAMPTHATFGTFVNASVVPHGSKLVLNVTYKVKNDEDSGNVGYWALDKYNKSLQVWKAPDGLFYVVAKYAGKWKTFEGALSPGDGIVESGDASGTFEGGYVATFTFSGDFNPEGNKTKGNIGTYDFGGTKEDVLLGTYGAGQTGSPEPFDALELYFPGHQDFTYIHWGWTYHYRNQTWNNFDYGTTGDIVK
jgi:hypothetical protein